MSSALALRLEVRRNDSQEMEIEGQPSNPLSPSLTSTLIAKLDARVKDTALQAMLNVVAFGDAYICIQ